MPPPAEGKGRRLPKLGEGRRLGMSGLNPGPCICGMGCCGVMPRGGIIPGCMPGCIPGWGMGGIAPGCGCVGKPGTGGCPGVAGCAGSAGAMGLGFDGS